MSAAEHAAEYVRKLRLASDTLGTLERITVDEPLQIVRVEWQRGQVERFSTERFVEVVKPTAARLGDAVAF